MCGDACDAIVLLLLVLLWLLGFLVATIMRLRHKTILPSFSNYTRETQAATKYYARKRAARGKPYRLPRHSEAPENADASRTHSHTQVARGTHSACTQAWRLNQASRSGSSARASVARLTPFSMPKPSRATSAHSAPRDPQIDAVMPAAMEPQPKICATKALNPKRERSTPAITTPPRALRRNSQAPHPPA